MALAEGERNNDAQRPIRGEGKPVGAAEDCSEAGLRGWQGPRISTFEAESNGQACVVGARGRGARQDRPVCVTYAQEDPDSCRRSPRPGLPGAKLAESSPAGLGVGSIYSILPSMTPNARPAQISRRSDTASPSGTARVDSTKPAISPRAALPADLA